MTKPNRTCSWCCVPLNSTIAKKNKVFCCTGCRDAEQLFEMHFSDEEIHRREHYVMLTSGS